MNFQIGDSELLPKYARSITVDLSEYHKFTTQVFVILSSYPLASGILSQVQRVKFDHACSSFRMTNSGQIAEVDPRR